MPDTQHLRPVERRVLRWTEAGLDDAEIGRRFVRSERWVALVRFLAELDRTDRPAPPPNPDTQLRPIERRLLRWRADGANHQELSDKFRRSADLLARIEDYANYKLAAS